MCVCVECNLNFKKDDHGLLINNLKKSSLSFFLKPLIPIIQLFFKKKYLQLFRKKKNFKLLEFPNTKKNDIQTNKNFDD